MNIATFIGRVGALAVTLGVGISAAAAPGVAMAEAADSSDTTAFLLSGTAGPKFNDAHVEVIMNQFIRPTHPNRIFKRVAVTTPEEAWPLTGVLRLVGLAFGDPSIGGPGGEMWPDVPWWKLSGLFDLTGDQSIQTGVADLEKEMAAPENANDHVVIYGYSQGAVVAVKEKRKLAEQYPAGTTAPDIDFVLGGDVGVPNGGFGARFPGLHIPVLEWSYDGADPTDTQFDTTVITHEYDGFADFPLYPLNIVADLNAVMGILYVHTWPFNVSLPADPTTSPAYQGTHGDSSYYFFDNPDLPLFSPLRQLGVPEALIDVVEPFFRVLVDLGYDRTIPAWEPTPARLLPTTFDVAKVATDLVNAIGEGINNAAALVGLPPPVSSPTAAHVASLEPADAAPNLKNTRIVAKVTASDAADQLNQPALTAPAGADLSAPKASVAQQNPPAAPTRLGPQTTPTVSTKPTAQWNPTRFTRRATEQNPVALTPTADNASEPSVKPKPSATTLTPKGPKPVGPAATRRPVGQPSHDVSAPRNGHRITAGSDSDGTPKASSTVSSSPGGTGS